MAICEGAILFGILYMILFSTDSVNAYNIYVLSFPSVCNIFYYFFDETWNGTLVYPNVKIFSAVWSCSETFGSYDIWPTGGPNYTSFSEYRRSLKFRKVNFPVLWVVGWMDVLNFLPLFPIDSRATRIWQQSAPNINFKAINFHLKIFLIYSQQKMGNFWRFLN